ncbi:MAG: Nif3-like dinuclear metal center hexameric protein [Bacteroidales bacterium]|nr:Nif3-like dinuclear metal center hexameric protein [Bacteroidales bacterium]
MPKISDIVEALEAFAPPILQESWDNTGLIIGRGDQECTGVLLCVDVTPGIVAEAIGKGSNLIVAHHPLIFRGLKRLNGNGRVERAAIDAIRAGVAIYACHTSVDNTVGGVSYTLARLLGLKEVEVLEQKPGTDHGIGLGVVGNLPHPMAPRDLVELVKTTCHSPVARCTAPPSGDITRVALCGGSGSEFIPQAIAAGAQAYITADTRYHDFCDYSGQIFIIDIGHFESEECTKEIFYQIIREKFPNFAVTYSQIEKNPIVYI